MRERAGLAVVSTLVAACATGRISVPPPGSPPAAYAGCTTSRRAPAIDFGLAGAMTLATVGLVVWHYNANTDGGTPLVAAIFTVPPAIGWTITGTMAWSKVSRCRSNRPGRA